MTSVSNLILYDFQCYLRVLGISVVSYLMEIKYLEQCQILFCLFSKYVFSVSIQEEFQIIELSIINSTCFVSVC